MIGKNRIRTWLSVVGMLIGWLLLAMVIRLIPSNTTVELSEREPTWFVNLAENGSLRSTFSAREFGLKRLDVLFKNPNLESRDELLIGLFGADGREIVSQPFTGFNFGDTSHARLDLPEVKFKPAEKLTLVIQMTKRVDGKLMVGTKQNDIDFIQYYGPATLNELLDNIVEIGRMFARQPLVLLLPMVALSAALW